MCKEHRWGGWVMCTHRGHVTNFTCQVRQCMKCGAEEHQN